MSIDDEYKLPCDVRLPNGMTICKGVHFKTLRIALQRREQYTEEFMLRFRAPQPSDGMVCVPREPTLTMTAEGWPADRCNMTLREVVECYKAMLRAAKLSQHGSS